MTVLTQDLDSVQTDHQPATLAAQIRTVCHRKDGKGKKVHFRVTTWDSEGNAGHREIPMELCSDTGKCYLPNRLKPLRVRNQETRAKRR